MVVDSDLVHAERPRDLGNGAFERAVAQAFHRQRLLERRMRLAVHVRRGRELEFFFLALRIDDEREQCALERDTAAPPSLAVADSEGAILPGYDRRGLLLPDRGDGLAQALELLGVEMRPRLRGQTFDVPRRNENQLADAIRRIHPLPEFFDRLGPTHAALPLLLALFVCFTEVFFGDFAFLEDFFFAAASARIFFATAPASMPAILQNSTWRSRFSRFCVFQRKKRTSASTPMSCPSVFCSAMNPVTAFSRLRQFGFLWPRPTRTSSICHMKCRASASAKSL